MTLYDWPMTGPSPGGGGLKSLEVKEELIEVKEEKEAKKEPKEVAPVNGKVLPKNEKKLAQGSERFLNHKLLLVVFDMFEDNS